MFRKAIVKKAESLGIAVKGAAVADLPKTRPLAGLWLRFVAAYAAVQTLTINRVEVVGNGISSPVNLSGQQLRMIAKHLTGTVPRYTNGAAAVVYEIPVHFGRYPRDPQMGLPTSGFSSLQVQVQYEHSAAPTSFSWDVIVDEFLNGAPMGIIRRVEAASKPGAAGAQEIDLPRGRPLRACYVYTDDPDNLGTEEVTISQNNDSVRWFVNTWANMLGEDIASGRFYDETTPTDPQNAGSQLVQIDFDPQKDLSGSLRTTKSDGVDDIKLRYTGAAAGTAGNVRVITEEVILY